jgi:hypothetical protein
MILEHVPDDFAAMAGVGWNLTALLLAAGGRRIDLCVVRLG